VQVTEAIVNIVRDRTKMEHMRNEASHIVKKEHAWQKVAERCVQEIIRN
jgi:hypothetical protein